MSSDARSKSRNGIGILRALRNTGKAVSAGGGAGALLVGMSERAATAGTVGRIKGRRNLDEDEKSRAASRVRSALDSGDDLELAEALNDFNALQG